jgi:hypothetical protein
VCQQLVRQQHRLRMLQVRHARNGGVLVPLSLPDERPLEFSEPRGDNPDLVPQVQAQVRGDLVIAAPAGSQLATQLPGSLQEAALQRSMHVLVFRGRPERARPAGAAKVVKRREHPCQLSIGQQAGLVQHARVRC